MGNLSLLAGYANGGYPADGPEAAGVTRRRTSFRGHLPAAAKEREVTNRSSDGEIPMFLGNAADGSVVVSDDVEVVKGGCGKSFAPFPPGCMFDCEVRLKSFERPMNKMKAMPRVVSEGAMCGSFFRVDS